MHPNGSSVVKEDDRNKAVIFDGRLSWAFTGLADIGSEPTAEWLAKQLHAISKQSLSEFGSELAQSATEAFGRIRASPVQKRHAFIAIGWWPTASMPRTFEPVILTISNATADGQSWQERACERFSAYITRPEDGITLCFAGQSVSKERLSRLKRSLKTFIERNALHASGDLLIKEVQHMASINQYVGHTVILISIPRAALSESGQFHVLNQKPSAEVAAYWYTSSTNEAQRSPTFVGDGILDNLVIYRGEAARREMQRMPSQEPPKPRLLILTPWAGTGSSKDDPRHGLVTEYKLDGWTDMVGALSWDKAFDCPYFGLIIGVYAVEDSVLGEIKADKRHVILADRQNPMQTVSDELIAQLEQWFLLQDATREELTAINLEAHRESLLTLIKWLDYVMKSLRIGHEETTLHQPPDGTGAGVIMGRKLQ